MFRIKVCLFNPVIFVFHMCHGYTFLVQVPFRSDISLSVKGPLHHSHTMNIVIQFAVCAVLHLDRVSKLIIHRPDLIISVRDLRTISFRVVIDDVQGAAFIVIFPLISVVTSCQDRFPTIRCVICNMLQCAIAIIIPLNHSIAGCQIYQNSVSIEIAFFRHHSCCISQLLHTGISRSQVH